MLIHISIVKILCLSQLAAPHILMSMIFWGIRVSANCHQSRICGGQSLYDDKIKIKWKNMGRRGLGGYSPNGLRCVTMVTLDDRKYYKRV